jgi:hypothetical protein
MTKPNGRGMVSIFPSADSKEAKGQWQKLAIATRFFSAGKSLKLKSGYQNGRFSFVLDGEKSRNKGGNLGGWCHRIIAAEHVAPGP